ncbi:MAG: hypothetical protein LBS82_01845 [Spirochaetaceae bacterium]|nr:hypothetical protein [Spirochaetaceae bacterium]
MPAVCATVDSHVLVVDSSAAVVDSNAAALRNTGIEELKQTIARNAEALFLQ